MKFLVDINNNHVQFNGPNGGYRIVNATVLIVRKLDIYNGSAARVRRLAPAPAPGKKRRTLFDRYANNLWDFNNNSIAVNNMKDMIRMEDSKMLVAHEMEIDNGGKRRAARRTHSTIYQLIPKKRIKSN